jgi:hypothetical protein
MAAPRAPFAALGGGFVVGQRPCELERRQGADQLRMGVQNMPFRVQVQLFKLLSPEDIPAAARKNLGENCHVADRTG